MAKPRAPTTPRIKIGEFSPGRKLTAVSMAAFPNAIERGALRCGLHDATILADQVARNITIEHTVRGRLTKKGARLQSLAKLIADLIWAMHEEVEVPHG